MEKLIKEIRYKLELNCDLVDKMFDNAVKNLEMVSELDIIQKYDINYNEYESLKNASQSIDITEEQLKEVIYILNIIEDKMKIMALVNDKVIRSGGKINKNTMAYILKKDNDKPPQNAVINVYIDDFGNPLRLNEVIGNEEKNKKEKKD